MSRYARGQVWFVGRTERENLEFTKSPKQRKSFEFYILLFFFLFLCSFIHAYNNDDVFSFVEWRQWTGKEIEIRYLITRKTKQKFIYLLWFFYGNYLFIFNWFGEKDFVWGCQLLNLKNMRCWFLIIFEPLVYT